VDAVGEPNQKSGSAFRGVGVAAALGAQLILAIVLGFLLGHWLDGVFHIAPWLTIAGVILGIVAGFMGLFHLSKVLMK
jgi:F0F1-type ATP synthase assembly protein I